MESKHTPGPWTVVTHYKTIDSDKVTGYSVDADLPSDGLTPEWYKVASGIETAANAALIAAAPDMRLALAETADRLSAWSDCLRDMRAHDQGTPEQREEWKNEADNYDRLLSLIIPALAKAEGR